MIGGTVGVRRTVTLIECIAAARDAMPVRDLIASLGIPRSSVYSMVRALTAAGWLRHDDGGVTLGDRLLGIVRKRDGLSEPLAVLGPIMERLRDRVHETVQLSVLDGDRAVVVAKAEGGQPISVASRVGMRIAINWSAAGRLLVSSLADADLVARLPGMIEPSPTGKAPTDPGRIRAEVRAAGRRGHCWQVNQSAPHTGAVAAALRGTDGRCVAALSIIAPEHRLREHRKSLLAAVIEAARTGSAALSAGGLLKPPGSGR